MAATASAAATTVPLAAADTLAGRLAMVAGVRAPLPDHPITFAQPRTEGERVFARLPILSIATMPAAYVASLGPLVKGRIVLIGERLPPHWPARLLAAIEAEVRAG